MCLHDDPVVTLRIEGMAPPNTLLMSRESPAIYPELRLNETGRHLGMATTSLQSDVPVIFFEWPYYRFDRSRDDAGPDAPVARRRVSVRGE